MPKLNSRRNRELEQLGTAMNHTRKILRRQLAFAETPIGNPRPPASPEQNPADPPLFAGLRQ